MDLSIRLKAIGSFFVLFQKDLSVIVTDNFIFTVAQKR